MFGAKILVLIFLLLEYFRLPEILRFSFLSTMFIVIFSFEKVLLPI